MHVVFSHYGRPIRYVAVLSTRWPKYSILRARMEERLIDFLGTSTLCKAEKKGSYFFNQII